MAAVDNNISDEFVVEAINDGNALTILGILTLSRAVRLHSCPQPSVTDAIAAGGEQAQQCVRGILSASPAPALELKKHRQILRTELLGHPMRSDMHVLTQHQQRRAATVGSNRLSDHCSLPLLFVACESARGVCGNSAHTMSIEPADAAPVGSAYVLLGVMSGSLRRRAYARCVYDQVRWPSDIRARALQPVRILFVVGRSASSADRALVAPADELHVPVDEPGSSSSFSTMGTVAVMSKVILFLRHAATQPEPCIAVCDDDTYVSLPYLLGLANEVYPQYERFYAGHFEWYNVVAREFRVTGWGAGPKQAAYAGRTLNNCTLNEIRRSASYDGSECVGPFAFAMGYLFMLSRPVVAELVGGSSWLQRDFVRAGELRGTRLPHAVYHDVQLGLWATQVAPGLTYVALEHLSILNVRGEGRYSTLDATTLLSAHRLPFACWANVSARTRRAPPERTTRLAFRHQCSHDTQGDKTFPSWTLRPSQARTCVLHPVRAAHDETGEKVECHAPRMQAELPSKRASATGGPPASGGPGAAASQRQNEVLGVGLSCDALL